MTTVPPTESSRDPAIELRNVRAQRDALQELIAIFAHDLSNPLQSVTVLTELALDDAKPGSDERERVGHTLEAADRMRKMIHGISAITRAAGQNPTVQTIVDRVLTVLRRRFERHHIAYSANIDPIAETRVAAGCELALMTLGLGVVAAASEGGHTALALRIEGRSGDDGPEIAFALAPEPPRDGAVARFSARYFERTHDALAGEPCRLLAEDPTRPILQLRPNDAR